jgi:hypothetical protein
MVDYQFLENLFQDSICVVARSAFPPFGLLCVANGATMKGL